MKSDSDAVLMAFAKNVVEGRVKTRLAEKVGDRRAADIYRKLLRYTSSVASKVEVDRQIWYDRQIPERPAYFNSGFSAFVQRGNGLGSRMQHAFKKAFDQGYRRVVIIGTDCAELTAGIVENALGQLRHVPVVMGPASDGGYYLLGMNRYFPFLFEHKSWSTEDVYDETIRDLQVHEIEWRELPVLTDVDRWTDWNNVRARIEQYSAE